MSRIEKKNKAKIRQGSVFTMLGYNEVQTHTEL